MAFCAKCGTPLNEGGVCPNCGYTLPQNNRPAGAGEAGNMNHGARPSMGGNPQPGGSNGPAYGGQPYHPGGSAGPGMGGQGDPGYGQGTPGYGQGGSGYGQGGAFGGQGGQNFGGQQMPVRQPSELGANLLNWFLGIFKKDPTEIFDSVSKSKSPVWMVYMGIFAFFTALSMACALGMGMNAVQMISGLGGFGDLVDAFHGVTVGGVIIVFLLVFIYSVGSMFLTALAVWLLLKLSGSAIPFLNACNVTVVAYIPSILASAFTFICSFTTITSMFAAFVSSVASIATMILLYCAITRINGNQKQLVWPYVITQVALKVALAIAAAILAFIGIMILGAMMASSISSFW